MHFIFKLCGLITKKINVIILDGLPLKKKLIYFGGSLDSFKLLVLLLWKHSPQMQTQ